MRKIIFALALIFAFASIGWAQSYGYGDVTLKTSSASVANCDSGTTCTNSDCGLWCEDFEGSSSCYSGYTSNCRTGFEYATQVGTSNAVTFGATRTSNTGACTTGTKVLEVAWVTPGASNSAIAEQTLTTGAADLMFQFYVYFDSWSITSGSDTQFFILQDPSCSNYQAELWIENTGGTYNLRVADSGAAHIVTGSTASAWTAEFDNMKSESSTGALPAPCS